MEVIGTVMSKVLFEYGECSPNVCGLLSLWFCRINIFCKKIAKNLLSSCDYLVKMVFFAKKRKGLTCILNVCVLQAEIELLPSNNLPTIPYGSNKNLKGPKCLIGIPQWFATYQLCSKIRIWIESFESPTLCTFIWLFL